MSEEIYKAGRAGFVLSLVVDLVLEGRYWYLNHIQKGLGRWFRASWSILVCSGSIKICIQPVIPDKTS